jgi:hypothetical protein
LGEERFGRRHHDRSLLLREEDGGPRLLVGATADEVLQVGSRIRSWQRLGLCFGTISTEAPGEQPGAIVLGTAAHPVK